VEKNIFVGGGGGGVGGGEEGGGGGGGGKHRGQDSQVFRVLSVNTKSTRARKHKTPMSGARAAQ